MVRARHSWSVGNLEVLFILESGDAWSSGIVGAGNRRVPELESKDSSSPEILGVPRRLGILIFPESLESRDPQSSWKCWVLGLLEFRHASSPGIAFVPPSLESREFWSPGILWVWGFLDILLSRNLWNPLLLKQFEVPKYWAGQYHKCLNVARFQKLQGPTNLEVLRKELFLPIPSFSNHAYLRYSLVKYTSQKIAWGPCKPRNSEQLEWNLWLLVKYSLELRLSVIHGFIFEYLSNLPGPYIYWWMGSCILLLMFSQKSFCSIPGLCFMLSGLCEECSDGWSWSSEYICFL